MVDRMWESAETQPVMIGARWCNLYSPSFLPFWIGNTSRSHTCCMAFCSDRVGSYGLIVVDFCLCIHRAWLKLFLCTDWVEGQPWSTQSCARRIVLPKSFAQGNSVLAYQVL